MIDQDDIHVKQSGTGYTIGEMRGQHELLPYLQTGALVCQFDGLDNMLAALEEHMPKPQRSGSSDSRGRDDFNAFSSYNQAMDVFRNKPQEVVKYDPGELRIKDESESGSRVDFDVVGDYIDMGRYMEGIPETWGTMHNGNARNRRVNILINVCHWAGVPFQDIIHGGERVLRLVDALEAGGVRTQLSVIKSDLDGHTELKLKRHDEPLTIADLAVSTHPEFLRRILFRVCEYSKTWTHGYGHAMELGEAIKVRPQLIQDSNNDEMTIYIDSSLQNISTIDRLFDQLERLLVWEMSKPSPEVNAVQISRGGIAFNANGTRSEHEIRREGLEAIQAD